MSRHLAILSFILVVLQSCVSNTETTENQEVRNELPSMKLDSIRSITTIITNNGDELNDTRSNIASGTYQIDTGQVIRSISFSIEEFLVDDLNYQMIIDMINLEPWDSTNQIPLKIDSAFYLSEVSHLALSNITLGDVTNEMLLPVQIRQDSLITFIEGKTTLTLKDWGFDVSEVHQLYLGLTLFTLPEN